MSTMLAFIREVILREWSGRRASTSKRIFATGMSNGAHDELASRLRGFRTIRAIAPVEGTDNTVELQSRASRSPSSSFTRLDDDDGDRSTADAGPSALHPDQLHLGSGDAGEMGTAWIAPRSEPQSACSTVAGAHCDLHPAKSGGAPVELCVTDTGGHSWPGGGTQQGRKQPSMAFSANDLMWRFFSSL